MTFPLDQANLVAIWLESVLYGVYVLLFCYTFYFLHRPRPYSTYNATNRTLLAACVALLVFSTSHMALSLRMLLEAFVLDKEIPGGPNVYFAEQGLVLNVLRKGAFALSVLIADSLMIYRCYILWHRNVYIIVLPVMSLCATVIASSFIAKELIHFQPSFETGIFTPKLDAWVPAYFILAFSTNLYLSACMAWKLWHASRKAQPDMLKFERMLATIIVVESNSIYPFINILALICWVARSNVQVILVNVLAQLIAITPTLMILQVQKGLYAPYSRSGAASGKFGTSYQNGAGLDVEKAQITDFASPYAFMPQPETPGVHFPSLSRTISMKTFKDRFSISTSKRESKKEGRVAYTKYGGTFGLPPALDLVLPPSRRSSMSKRADGVTVTSTVDVYDAVELGAP